MAQDKKSFVLYADLIHTLEKMPDDKAGLLFKHLLRYVNDLDPVTDDLIVELTFEPIKHQLKRDLEKWNESLEINRDKGIMGNLKRWNSDLYDKVKSGQMTIEDAEIIAKNRRTSHKDSQASSSILKIAVNDNVNVNDTVNVNDIKDIDSGGKPPVFNFKKELLKIGFDSKLVDEWLVVRKTKRLVNTETALKLFISEVDKTKKDINFILRKCVEKSWGGFDAKWLEQDIKIPEPDYKKQTHKF